MTTFYNHYIKNNQKKIKDQTNQKKGKFPKAGVKSKIKQYVKMKFEYLEWKKWYDKNTNTEDI